MATATSNSTFKLITGPMRLPFLLLPPACVLLGVAVAVWTHGQINVLYAVLAFIGALASHISVNAFNEYSDYKSGSMPKHRRRPSAAAVARCKLTPNRSATPCSPPRSVSSSRL